MSSPVFPPPSADTRKRENPFVGPQSIAVGAQLYGRAVETLQLRDRLVADRIVLLYSPSGAGKTSLVNAGLRPLLKDLGFAMLPAPIEFGPGRSIGGAVRVNHPSRGSGNRYVESVKQSLEAGRNEADRYPPEELVKLSLTEYLEATAIDAPEGAPRCLLFDQFEELITLDPTDGAEKQVFMAQLGDALRNRRIWALFAMREDYLAPLDEYRDWIPTHLRSRFRLELLTAAQAHAVAVEAAASEGVTITDAAAGKLVGNLQMVQVPGAGRHDLVQGPHVEPVQLQVVCSSLWNELGAEQDTIDVAQIPDSAGVDDALAAFYADEVAAVAATTGVSERVIRDWVETELISPEGFRTQSQAFARDDGDAVLDGLVDAHVIRADYRNETRWFELSHDRLVGPVRSSNARWRRDELEPLQRRSVVWRDDGKPADLLMRGTELRQAKRWAKDHDDELDDVDREYLEAGKKQSSRKVRVWSLGLLAVGAVAAAALLLVRQSEVNAEKQRVADELTAVGFAQQSAGLQASEPARALAVAAESTAVTDEPTASSFAALVDARATYRERPWLPASVSPIDHDLPRRVAVAVDGLVAYGDDAGEVTIRSLVDPDAAATTIAAQPGKPITDLAFSGERDADSDSFLLASTSRNSADIVILNPTSGDEVGRVNLETDDGTEVNTVVFRPGSTTEVAVGDSDGRVWLCDVPAQSCAELDVGEVDVDPEASIEELAFDENGDWLVTASSTSGGQRTGQVVVWDMQDPDGPVAERILERTAAPDDAEPGVLKVAVTGDELGPVVAVGEVGGGVWAWDDPFDGEVTPTFVPGHPDDIGGLAFDPDGSGRLVSAGAQSEEILTWRLDRKVNGNIAFARVDRPLTAHSAFISDLVYAPDELGLVSVSEGDGTVRVWERPTIDQTGVSVFGSPPLVCDAACWTRSVVFVSDTEVASIDGAGQLRLWDVDDDDAVAAIDVDREGFAVAYGSEDNVVAAGVDGQVVLWYLDEPDELERLWDSATDGEPDRPVRTVAFDESTGLLASGDDCGWVRTWKIADSLEAVDQVDLSESEDCPEDIDREIASVAFGDGRVWVSGEGGLVAEVEVADDGTLGAVTDRTGLDSGNVRAIEVGREGALLAVAGEGQVVLVVDQSEVNAASGLQLTGHGNEIGAIAISQETVGDDLTLLASASNDGAVRLWWIGPNTGDQNDAGRFILRASAVLPPSGRCASTDLCFALDVALSDDGSTLASVGTDGLVHVWRGLTDPDEACALVTGLVDADLLQRELGSRSPERCTDL